MDTQAYILVGSNTGGDPVSAIEAGCSRSQIDTVMSVFLFQLLLHSASIALKNSIEVLLL